MKSTLDFVVYKLPTVVIIYPDKRMNGEPAWSIPLDDALDAEPIGSNASEAA